MKSKFEINFNVTNLFSDHSLLINPTVNYSAYISVVLRINLFAIHVVSEWLI